VERIFNLARNLHEYHRAQLSPDTITKSMIVKHFNRYKWELPGEWENVDHRYGGPDPDHDIEDNERQIAEKAVISDDEVEIVSDNEGVRARRLRFAQRAETPRVGRRTRPSDLEIDELSPEKSQVPPSQRWRR
jgi:hypothetical protein